MKSINSLLLVLLFCSTLQMKFKAVTDPEFIIEKTDMLEIEREIKNIEDITGIQVTLFVMSSMHYFKQSNNLPVSVNDTNAVFFADDLYEVMYKGSSLGNKSILVIISVNDKVFRARIGVFARKYVTDATATEMFKDVSDLITECNYSTAARVYIHKLNLDLTYNSSNGRPSKPLNCNGVFCIILIMVVLACCACCWVAYFTDLSTVGPTYHACHYDEFTRKMNKLRDISAGYTGSNILHDYCVMCFEGFCVFKPASSLPCGHRFHPSCLQAIMLRGGNCPSCANNWDIMGRDQFIYSLGNYHMGMYPELGSSYTFRWENGNYYMDNNSVGFDNYGNQDRDVTAYNYVTNANYNENQENNDYYREMDDYQKNEEKNQAGSTTRK